VIVTSVEYPARRKGRVHGGNVAATSSASGRPLSRSVIAVIVVAVAAVVIVVATQLGGLFSGGTVAATSTPGAPSQPAPSTIAVGPSAAPPSEAPPATEPPPTQVPAPLTGLLVSPEVAAQHPIAVMVDDQFYARPQSGFNSAAIVWHAPAEGGIPRYMLIFQDEVAPEIGPVRSSRLYYIQWAAEWNSLYVHAGGSPQAIRRLNRSGHGEWVWNADQFKWGTGAASCAGIQGCFLWRTTERFPPHDVYTDGKHLRRLADRVGAEDADAPIAPAWTFGADKAAELRPDGGLIRVNFPDVTITYRYDAETNSYQRYVGVSRTPQVDPGDGEVVAPKNVVILRMQFGPLRDNQTHGRLEAHNIGKGVAYISTGGVTIKGEWRKKSATAPTLLFDQAGNPITLTAGQTFIEVIQTSYTFKIRDGAAPGGAAVSPAILGRLGP
jgi:hypothetical protein